MVHGYEVLMVLYNNGQDLYCGSNCCSASEWNFIYQQIFSTRRQLRGENDIDEENGIHEENDIDEENGIHEENEADNITNTLNNDARELYTYPRQCAARCSAFPTGRCMAIQCLGYRNRMLFPFSESCPTQMNAFQTAVTRLSKSTKLRSSCRALLKAPLLGICESNAIC